MLEKIQKSTMWNSSTSQESIFSDSSDTKVLDVKALQKFAISGASAPRQLDVAPYRTSFDENSLGYIVS